MPDLLGQTVYTLSQGVGVDEDFPYPCSAGILGSNESDFQTSALCAGMCPEGHKCPNAATTEAIICEAGTYCPEGSSMSLPCPSGSYSSATGLQSVDQCTTCPSGHFCATGSTAPTECTPGSFAASSGSAVCTSCAEGSYQGEKGQASCIVCKAGYYCPSGSSSPVPCEGGTVGAEEGLAAAAAAPRARE